MTEKIRYSRATSFTWVIVAYLAAFVVGIGSAYYYAQTDWYDRFLPDYQELVLVAVADLVATVVIFIFGYIFKNSSFYDPYWSVIPLAIVAWYAWLGWDTGQQVRIVLLVLLVFFWGIRLTFNWARGWPGMHHEDWRYVDLAKQSGKAYWLVSFTGIMLFPTILVYLGCLPLYPAMVLSDAPLNVLDGFATLFTLGAILIEFIADEQLRKFVIGEKAPGEIMTRGLWGYSRHPNYFGETSFWWGLFFFGLAAGSGYWWTGIGALSMTLLFHFISIPMIDKRHLARRPGYDQIIGKIPRWIPWFPKK